MSDNILDDLSAAGLSSYEDSWRGLLEPELDVGNATRFPRSIGLGKEQFFRLEELVPRAVAFKRMSVRRWCVGGLPQYIRVPNFAVYGRSTSFLPSCR